MPAKLSGPKEGGWPLSYSGAAGRRLAATSRPAPRSRSPGAPPLASAPSRRRPAAATRPGKWKKVEKGGQENRPHYESDSSAISSIFASSSGSTSPCISGFIAMNWAAHCKSYFVRKAVLWSDQPRSSDTCDSSSARHPENQGRPNDGVGEPPPHEAARCLRLHWPPAAGHSAEPVGHRATSAFWSSPPGDFGFVSTPPLRPFLT